MSTRQVIKATLRTAMVAPLAAISACAFFDPDENGNNNHDVCMSTAECGADEMCNLITQRCQKKGNIAENQLIIDYRCPVFRSGGEPGPAYASLNFGGRKIDSGFGCFARLNSAGTLDLTLASTTDNETVLTLEIWDAAATPSPAAVPAKAMAYFERRDENTRLQPIAVSIGGSISFSGVPGAVETVEGKADVTLEAALARDQPCTASEPDRYHCGSGGSGRFCVDEATDPSGVATCRDMCMDDLPCTGSAESCTPLYGSVAFCIPTELLETPCTLQSECEPEETCVTGAGGQAYCRPNCDPEAAPSCTLDALCASLEGGGGACLPDPCDTLQCGDLQGCRRASAIAASCVEAGGVIGSFTAQISSAQSPVYGNATASGSTPMTGSWTAGGMVFADLYTSSSHKQYLRVVIFGPDVQSRRDLMLLVPIAKAQPGFVLHAGWDAAAALGIAGGSAEVEGISGVLTFTEAGATMGHAVSGSFAIVMGAVLR